MLPNTKRFKTCNECFNIIFLNKKWSADNLLYNLRNLS